MMPSLATFRVVVALVWLAMPFWFESTKVPPNNNARKDFIVTRRTAEKSELETFVHPVTGTSKSNEGTTAPTDGFRRRSRNRKKSRTTTTKTPRQPEFLGTKENEDGKEMRETKKPRLNLNTEIPSNPDQSRKEPASKNGHKRTSGRPSVEQTQRTLRQGKRNKAKTESAITSTTPSPTTETNLWEDNYFLKLGLNPKIEVGIDILHDHQWTIDQQVSKVPSESDSGSGTGALTTASPKQNKTGGDMCQRWLNCPGDRQLVELARFHDLPSCPCTYSFDIHYKDEVWDRGRRRPFRWRDASGPPDQVDTFRPGAHWCIRSLVSDSAGGSGMATQQCCYDQQRKLLTRGAGAGTPNVISPEVSRELHQKVDVMPWMVCRGDWTRYHMRRKPNNGLNCPENPGNRVYLRERHKAKNY